MTASVSLQAQESGARWWPAQKLPRGMVVIEGCEEGTGAFFALNRSHMLAQSLAGIAAQKVNAGEYDEMVWIDDGTADTRAWYEGAVRRMGLDMRGRFDVWGVLGRLQDAGIVNGYVLYLYDESEGAVYSRREEVDHSVNVATVAAAMTGGVLIDVSQEKRAREMGLKRLFDARGKDMRWCFDTYCDRMNRRILLTVDPKVPHNRAMAIAHRCMVVYDTKEPVPEIMEWLEPLSPIMGWNCGHEDEHTGLPSRYGHFQTASNWALNLTVLSAGSERAKPGKVKSLDPSDIDWDDTRHGVSFILSDGDNVQWLMTNFFRNKDRYYWNSPDSGKFPFGWTACMAHLSQVCPEAAGHLIGTQHDNASIIEYGGGYHYPDTFASARQDTTLQAQFARKIGAYLKARGVKVFGFICKDVSSEAAQRAYRTFARELDGIVGMIAVQYYPYDGGDGEIYWVPNRDGVDIPVVTCKYSLWADAHWPRGGTPAKIARLINEDAEAAERDGDVAYSWAVVHAWSGFKHTDGDDENAENAVFRAPGTRAGVTPVSWCIDRFDEGVTVMSPEEMLWRIRMRHDPEETRRIIEGR